MKPTEFSQPKALAPATFSRRSTLREERHPNAVTAPPVNRGSMTPRPWRGPPSSRCLCFLCCLRKRRKLSCARPNVRRGSMPTARNSPPHENAVQQPVTGDQ